MSSLPATRAQVAGRPPAAGSKTVRFGWHALSPRRACHPRLNHARGRGRDPVARGYRELPLEIHGVPLSDSPHSLRSISPCALSALPEQRKCPASGRTQPSGTLIETMRVPLFSSLVRFPKRGRKRIARRNLLPALHLGKFVSAPPSDTPPVPRPIPALATAFPRPAPRGENWKRGRTAHLGSARPWDARTGGAHR
jgi:hypothetical protein